MKTGINPRSQHNEIATATFSSLRHGFGPGARTEFAEQRFHVKFDRVQRVRRGDVRSPCWSFLQALRAISPFHAQFKQGVSFVFAHCSNPLSRAAARQRPAPRRPRGSLRRSGAHRLRAATRRATGRRRCPGDDVANLVRRMAAGRRCHVRPIVLTDNHMARFSHSPAKRHGGEAGCPRGIRPPAGGRQSRYRWPLRSCGLPFRDGRFEP